MVYKPDSAQPYVGFEHLLDEPDGWQYDIRRWCGLFDLRIPSLPRLGNPSSQGLNPPDYFKPGVGSVNSDDLDVRKISKLSKDHEYFWVPIVSSGYYFRYNQKYFYYSDDSRIEYIDPASDRLGRNYITLEADPDFRSPITAATYQRADVSKTPTYYTQVYQRHAFSGEYISGVQQETVGVAQQVNWDNVDFTKKEFIVDSSIDGQVSLVFNRNYVEVHGVVPQVYQDLGACSFLGISNGSEYQVFYLKHFPVLADSTFHLYITTGTGTWEEWDRIDDWWDLLTLPATSQKKYFLDKDLGIVYLGGRTTGGVPSFGAYILASYRTTLRVEYNESDRPWEIQAWNADTNPITQHINQGFVCITHERLEPASISLKIDKSVIPFTNPVEYGPITVGSDYGVLEATVANPEGLPVPDIEVGFTMSPLDIGYLSGSTIASAVTNGSGKAYASYQPPVSADTIGIYSTVVRNSTHPSYTSHREIIINFTDPGLEGKESEIYLYQILKDDVLLGYATLDDFFYYELTAPAWVQDSDDYAQWKQEMITKYELKEFSGLGPNNKISGRKVVVYQISGVNNTDANAIHPVTGKDGAVVPVRPVLIDQITDTGDPYYGLWRLIYPEGAVPYPSLSNNNVPVGGYWIVSSRLVKFQAHCWSPYYNSIIYSNEITARISLPQYLLGEYLKDTQKIPYGWKLLSDLDNVAAGIDGATFITINPYSGPYQILDLVYDTTPQGAPDGWANAPFKSLGLEIEIVDSPTG
jgi:hypothetical protein